MRFARHIAVCLLLSLATAGDADARMERLAQIRERGALVCGIWPEVAGFASRHEDEYRGFDVDTCRAVAAAILGDASKTQLIPLERVRHFHQRDEIDLVVRRLTWTPPREAAAEVTFGPVTFYDGQGFLVRKDRGIERIAQLAGERVCVIAMERHPQFVFEYFEDHGWRIDLLLVASDAEALAALRDDRCLAYSADVSWLAAARAGWTDGVKRFEILPTLISKEPLAPLVRAQDTDLAAVVRWTIFTLIEAEELGLGSADVQAAASSRSARVRRFLNIHPREDVVPRPGEWVPAILAAVGNYGELYERNLGRASPIRLERGLNRLWRDGGLMYAPPLDR